MNRESEYTELLAELEVAPPALAGTVACAKERRRKALRLRRAIATPVTGAAIFLVVFIAAINTSVAFAMACGKIPLLRELAAAVAFSPSLSAAVENEYVQPIDLEQTVNGVTMRVEYIIVDQKQLNIFYTLRSPEYSRVDATPDIRALDDSALTSYVTQAQAPSPMRDNGDIRQFTVDFIQSDVPSGLILECRVYDNGGFEVSEPTPIDLNEPDHTETLPEPVSVAVFSFTLGFDPEYTRQGETIALNQALTIDGQRFTLTSADIYPTHIRLNIDDDKSNTAWLQSLTFFFVNEKRARFDAIKNGITATGSVGSRAMVSHRIESSFFSKSKTLTMYITDAVWLDKDAERIEVDLANTTADRLPEGVVFESAVRGDTGWQLTFSAPAREDGGSYQLFGTDYYDAAGTGYEYNHWTSVWGYYDEATGLYEETPGVFRVSFSLTDYPYDTVLLSPSFSRSYKLAEPIKVRVK